MLQRLQIALAQIKTGSTFENCQIIYSFFIEQKKLLKQYRTI